MSVNFNIVIDKANVEKRLGDMKNKAPLVIARALNDTAQNARTRLGDKAREVYTVKKGGFNRAMTLKRATSGSLVAVLNASGSPIPLKDFSHYGGQNKRRLSTMVARPAGRKTWGADAFFNKISGGGQKGGGHTDVATRVGKSRLPIKKRFSLSVPYMIGSEKYVYGVIKPHIQSDLQKNITREINRLLGGF